MHLGSKIYIAGHTGMVGSAIRRRLEALGYSRLSLRTCSDLDLTRQQAVEEFFGWGRFDYVFIARSNGGAPTVDNSFPANLLYQNLAIESNIISSAYQAGVKRLLFVGSGCIVPRFTLHAQEKGAGSRGVDYASRTYAIAKAARIEMCNAYNQLDGCRFLGVVPPNLYGCRDTYDAHNLRLIPAMMLKMHWAKVNGEQDIVLCGAGDVRQDILFSDDLADICISLMNLDDPDFDFLVSRRTRPLIHIGGENDLTARQLAEIVAEVVMFRGKVRFDVETEDNTNRRPHDLDRNAVLRSRPQIDVKEGLHWVYEDFLSHTRVIAEKRLRESPPRNCQAAEADWDSL